MLWRRLLAPMAIALLAVSWMPWTSLAGGTTGERAELPNPGLELVPGTRYWFGWSVAAANDTVVVGVPMDSTNVPLAGSAYVFVRNEADAWSQQAKLRLSHPAWNDELGVSVAISGETVILGARLNSDNGIFAGAAYVFVRDAKNHWTQQAQLLAADGADSDFFGSSVAINGNIAVVGAVEDERRSGSVYIFNRDTAGVWNQQAKLQPSIGTAGNRFGGAVAISGDSLIIGATGDDQNGLASGSAYIFKRDATGAWTQQAKLLPNDVTQGDRFGNAVAISGDENTAFIGVEGKDDNGDQSGAVYVFSRNGGGVWIQQSKILAPDGAPMKHFGSSVAASRNLLIVGSRRDNVNGSWSGSVYLFERDESQDWTLQTKLLAVDGYNGDEFGLSVAISGDTIVAGAPHDNNNHAGDSGSAYIFKRGPNHQWRLQTKTQACVLDLNGDGVINSGDLAITLARLGAPGVPSPDTILANWGIACP